MGYLLVSRLNVLYTPLAWIPRVLGLPLISDVLTGNKYNSGAHLMWSNIGVQTTDVRSLPLSMSEDWSVHKAPSQSRVVTRFSEETIECLGG